MHKKIKHIIAVSLVIGTISCVLPANNFALGTAEAYASTYRSASDGELNSLTITRSTGSEIELLDTYEGNESVLSGNKDYYMDLTGADGFYISAGVQGSGYVVKVFTSADKTAEGKDIGEYVNIDSTYEDVYLRTYKSEDAYKEAYGNKDVTDCENTYIIHVKKPDTSDITSDTELAKDYAYLQGIYLSNGDINFSKEQYSYNVNVNDNVEELLIRATPDNTDDVVEINGQSVEESDNFEKTVSLNKGNNTITIYVKSNDDDETYTLNVYRGSNSTSATSTSASQESTSLASGTPNNAVTSDSSKFNSWQKVNGKLEYIDGTGVPLKNQWWFDSKTGKTYYLKEDGTMATGWLYDGSNWFYLNEKGEIQTGWMQSGKNWYYLNERGVMQSGWLEDSSGNWYYLDSSGAMKTGWIESSNGTWYYLDSTGKMTDNTAAN